MKNYSFSYKYILAASLLLVGYTAAWAADDEEGVDSSSASSTPGHWYLGASTGYLKPDGGRLSGNTRSLGFQGGYQFNDKWSMELGFQEDALAPGKDDLRLRDLNVVRAWGGDDARFLLEFGSTSIALGHSGYPSTTGFHIGAGLSTFITENWELRGDIKLVQTTNGNLHDGLGTVSLNYHFVEAHAVTNSEDQSVLGASEGSQSLPPMQYREPVETKEAAAVVAEVDKRVYSFWNCHDGRC